MPFVCAVTTPLASTVATAGSLEVQVTVRSVALSGCTVAVSCRVSPAVNSAVVWLSAIEVASWTTVTVQVDTGKEWVVELVSEAITLLKVMTHGPVNPASATTSNVTSAPLLPLMTDFWGEATRMRIAPDESWLAETVCARLALGQVKDILPVFHGYVQPVGQGDVGLQCGIFGPDISRLLLLFSCLLFY